MDAEWTSFAKSGVPSAPGAAPWPRFTAADQQMESLVPPNPQPEARFNADHHCALWALGGD
jgi:carboxylesterase type B